MSDFIEIADNKFETLIAVTSEEQSKGLMFYKQAPTAMSFVYKTPKINKFWMKNTYCPLDIVFCCNNKIVNICKGEPLSTTLIGDESLSDLVVEFPAGTCDKYGFKIGDKIKLNLSFKNLAKLSSY